MKQLRGWLLTGYIVFLGSTEICRRFFVSWTNLVFAALARRSMSSAGRKVY